MDEGVPKIGNPYTLEKEFGMTPLPVEQFQAFGRSILIIAAADGVLHPREFERFFENWRRLGAPMPQVEEMRNFDYVNEKLEDNLPQGITQGGRRVLIYHAIQIAQADDRYHEKEQAAVHKAAAKLDVHPAVVTVLESLVDIEFTILRKRRELFAAT